MQTQNLQIIPKGVKPIIRASQFDVGREFELKLYDGAVAYTPPAGTTLRLDGVKPDGTVFSYTENLSLSGSTITVTTTTQMTILEGTVQCEIRMTKDNDDIGTINFDLMVEKSPINETTDLSQTEIPALVILTRMQMENAEAWAVGTKDGEPVSPDDPQYENSAKYWAEHAKTRLSGLEDVEFTSLANKQSLVYDATAQKWINGSISASDVNYTNTTSGLAATKVQAAIDEVVAKNQTLTNEANDIVNVLSAKNLWSETIPPTANVGGSYTLANHEYVVSTTASANSGVYWSTDKLLPFYADKVGVSAKLSFEVKADAAMRAYAGFYNNEVNLTTNYQKIEQDIADLSQIASAFKVYNLDTTSAHTIYVKNVMIRPASITSNAYVPYAMTNRELTDRVVKSSKIDLPSTSIAVGSTETITIPAASLPSDFHKALAIIPISVGPEGWSTTLPGVITNVNLTNLTVSVRAYTAQNFAPTVILLYV